MGAKQKAKGRVPIDLAGCILHQNWGKSARKGQKRGAESTSPIFRVREMGQRVAGFLRSLTAYGQELPGTIGGGMAGHQTAQSSFSSLEAAPASVARPMKHMLLLQPFCPLSVLH